MRSFLLSWLARRYREYDLRAFVQERPEDWLVWEAGPWRPPSPRRPETLSTTEVVGIASDSGEPLALVLAPPEGSRVVRVGRAADNDLVIDDATMSRAHLALARHDGRWLVRDVGSSNGTRVGAVRIGADPVPLRAGSVIEAGAARLTFYDPPGMFLRLRGAV